MIDVGQKIKIITFLLILGLINACNQKSRTEYSDMESLLVEISKDKIVEFNKYPPRLVKVFLKFEKSNNDGLIELLEMSELFIVVHIPKTENDSLYKYAFDEVEYHLAQKRHDKIKSIKFEKIIFSEFFHQKDEGINELILEIDEPNLYTIYCLKGNFSREDIIRVSNIVSPVEFLKLNRKIRRSK